MGMGKREGVAYRRFPARSAYRLRGSNRSSALAVDVDSPEGQKMTYRTLLSYRLPSLISVMGTCHRPASSTDSFFPSISNSVSFPHRGNLHPSKLFVDLYSSRLQVIIKLVIRLSTRVCFSTILGKTTLEKIRRWTAIGEYFNCRLDQAMALLLHTQISMQIGHSCSIARRTIIEVILSYVHL